MFTKKNEKNDDRIKKYENKRKTLSDSSAEINYDNINNNIKDLLSGASVVLTKKDTTMYRLFYVRKNFKNNTKENDLL